jgi:hypothetical protein
MHPTPVSLSPAVVLQYPECCDFSGLVLTHFSNRPILSVVLSVGGGIARHFTWLDIGRWRGRGEKC